MKQVTLVLLVKYLLPRGTLRCLLAFLLVVFLHLFYILTQDASERRFPPVFRLAYTLSCKDISFPKKQDAFLVGGPSDPGCRSTRGIYTIPLDAFWARNDVHLLMCCSQYEEQASS